MKKLIEELRGFENNIKDVTNETELQNLFEKLAPAFLYGGYIKVREDYKVYIRTVEFYFHSEKPNGIHDPIVYHRNGRDLEQAPFFPFMSIHAHNSGFDITFENKDREYRASALIRSYEVIAMRDNKFLKWDPKERMFKDYSDYCFNTQSTYLYSLLNGFSLGNSNDIEWVDFPRESKINSGRPRQNVFQSESEWEYQPVKGKRCERKWSFTREEPV